MVLRVIVRMVRVWVWVLRRPWLWSVRVGGRQGEKWFVCLFAFCSARLAVFVLWSYCQLLEVASCVV